ncbi:POK6 protein, partial [Aphelocoma coerulescens]|nr:POK6 protein [Aphelocoma coerulescens]
SAETANIPDIFAQAKLSDAFYHQNVPALTRMFKLLKGQVRAIVATCPNCQNYQILEGHLHHYKILSMGTGANSQGLNSCQLWQSDVTPFPSFGKSKCVHVSVDMFSGAVFASAHAGVNATHTIKHFLLAFSTLGVPEQIKTDYGPAYTSGKLKDFFSQWGVKQTRGIPA